MRKHPTIPDIYVTNEGRVFLELGTSPAHGGYHLCKSGAVNARRHVLVCETYHGPRPDGGVVRHLNGIPSDDRPENLSWGTQRENCEDTIKHGKSTRGARNPQAKVTARDVLDIRARWASGESPTSIASEYGISQPGVQDIVRGRTWAHLPMTTRKKWGL